ncbi:MAG: hypothetical protein EHM78_07680 [Myxococcaceae bacterium]|jgi:hypothetical protein|nr:MAG: hypothetical protein EHM78_07680 [Myxococcaceae bacterium]
MPASPAPPVPDRSLGLELVADPEAIPPGPRSEALEPGRDDVSPPGPRLPGADVVPPRSALPGRCSHAAPSARALITARTPIIAFFICFLLFRTPLLEG